MTMEPCRTIFVMVAITFGTVFGQSTVQQSTCTESRCVRTSLLDIQTNYHRQEHDMRDLLKKLETIVSDHNTLKSRVDKLMADNVQLQENNEKLTNNITELALDKNQLNEKIEKLQENVTKLMSENVELRNEIMRNRTTTEQSNEAIGLKVNLLASNVTSLTSLVDGFSNFTDNMIDSSKCDMCAELYKKVEVMIGNMTLLHLQAGNVTLTGDINALRGDYNVLREEVGNLAKNMTSITSSYNMLHATASTDNFTDVKRKVAELSENVNALISHNNIMNEKMDNLTVLIENIGVPGENVTDLNRTFHLVLESFWQQSTLRDNNITELVKDTGDLREKISQYYTQFRESNAESAANITRLTTVTSMLNDNIRIIMENVTSLFSETSIAGEWSKSNRNMTGNELSREFDNLVRNITALTSNYNHHLNIKLDGLSTFNVTEFNRHHIDIKILVSDLTKNVSTLATRQIEQEKNLLRMDANVIQIIDNMKELKSEKDKLVDSVTNLTLENNNISSNIDQIMLNLTALSSNKDTLVQNMSSVMSHKHELGERIEEIVQNITSMRSVQHNLETNISVLTLKTTEFYDLFEQVTRNLTSLKLDKDQLSDNVTLLTLDSYETNMKIDKMNVNVTALAIANDALTTSIIGLTSEKEEISRNVESIISNISALTLDNDKLSANVSVLTSDKIELFRNIEATIGNITLLESDNNDLADRIKALTSYNGEINNTIEKIITNITVLASDKEKLLHNMTTLASDNENLVDMVMALTSDKDEINMNIDQIKRNVTGLISEKDEIVDKVMTLITDNEETNIDIEEIIVNITDLTSDKQQLFENVKSLTLNKNEINKTLDQLVKNITSDKFETLEHIQDLQSHKNEQGQMLDQIIRNVSALTTEKDILAVKVIALTSDKNEIDEKVDQLTGNVTSVKSYQKQLDEHVVALIVDNLKHNAKLEQITSNITSLTSVTNEIIEEMNILTWNVTALILYKKHALSEKFHRIMENFTGLSVTTNEHSRQLNSMATDLNNKVGNLEHTYLVLSTRVKNLPYTTYIRWGRTICPNSTTTVYEGITAGSHWQKTGGGAEFQCLPLQPQWGNFNDRTARYSALIYGVEYQVEKPTYPNPFLHTNAPSDSDSLNDREVPCVLCAVPRTTTLMIPARNTCPSGWTKEYHGYLMADFTGGHRTSWICVDEAPEAKQGRTGDNDNQSMVYVVEAKCGSLPCSRYINGRELTCVVCTR